MFSGTVKTEWIEDSPRDMRILSEIRYIDPKGVEWIVPVDAIINGASIPKRLWSLIGSPFVGRYRRASVFHDQACTERTRPWKQVHKMFYYAMLEDGVPKDTAYLMYVAVRDFGPRWDENGNEIKSEELDLYPFDLTGDI